MNLPRVNAGAFIYGSYIYSSDSELTRKPPPKPANTSQPSCRPRQRRDEASSPDTMIAATMGQKSDMTPMILSMTNRAVDSRSNAAR